MKPLKAQNLTRRGIPSDVLRAVDEHDTATLEKLGVRGSYSIAQFEIYTGLYTGQHRSVRRVYCATKQLPPPLDAPRESLGPDTILVLRELVVAASRARSALDAFARAAQAGDNQYAVQWLQEDSARLDSAITAALAVVLGVRL